jgi:hypothetical protein
MVKPKWDKAMSERWLIRVMAIGVGFLGYIGFHFNPDCSKTGCPAYALANPWILRGERGSVLAVGAVFILAIVWRMLWHGRLPDQIGRDGVSWKEEVTEVNQKVISLTKSVSDLEDEVEKLLSNKGGVAPAVKPPTV